MRFLRGRAPESRRHPPFPVPLPEVTLVFHAPHRYDAAFRLKISPLLWIAMLHGLRHAMFLLAAGTPAAILLDGGWMRLQATPLLLPADALVAAVLLVAGHRVAGAKAFVRRLWHAGRATLIAAYVLDMVLFAAVRREVLATPQAPDFATALAVLAIDAAVALFLVRSRLVRDIFADFPEATDGRTATSGTATAPQSPSAHHGIDAVVPLSEIVPGAASTAFAVLEEMDAPGVAAIATRLHVEGRLAEAEVAYRHVLATDAALASAWHGLGMLAVQTDRLDAAAILVGQAIRRDDTIALYHRNFGEICRRLGRVGEAIGAGHVATTLAPDDAEAGYNLALALTDGRRIDEAIESYRRALAIQPRHGAAWNNLGVLLKQRGEMAAARRAFEAALAIDRAHHQAAANLRSLDPGRA